MRLRIIPAYAGEPVAGTSAERRTWDYPRVCGGAHDTDSEWRLSRGLSPRMRGSHRSRPSSLLCCGIIPAYAGEPLTDRHQCTISEDYPRVCGGAVMPSRRMFTGLGLSPRMRGSPVPPGERPHVPGIIPAYAGEPFTPAASSSFLRDYPRVCGGAGRRGRPAILLPGLSPRMRGSRQALQRPGGGLGIIPAYAGEPGSSAQAHARLADYPRVCGGAELASCWPANASGLSPRMRGSPQVRERRDVVAGIIPAYAGEPATTPQTTKEVWDYPRVCGGAGTSSFSISETLGLSPRMRGSRVSLRLHQICLGIIPAYAGEPFCARRTSRSSRDYPRVCGGAL